MPQRDTGRLITIIVQCQMRSPQITRKGMSAKHVCPGRTVEGTAKHVAAKELLSTIHQML